MRNADVVLALVSRDLKLKYKGSYIGFLWSLINPLVMLTIYTWVFGTIMKTPIKHFAVYLMAGLIPWTFFSTFVSSSVDAFVGNAGIITKVNLSKLVYIFSGLFFNLFIFLMMLGIILITVPFFGVQYTVNLLLIPVAILVETFFLLGLSMIISVCSVFFHDTGHIVEIILLGWFWITPVVYDSSSLPTNFRGFLNLNPMAFIISLYQSAILGKPMYGSISEAVIMILATFILGVFIYKKYTPQLAEWV